MPHYQRGVELIPALSGRRIFAEPLTTPEYGPGVMEIVHQMWLDRTSWKVIASKFGRSRGSMMQSYGDWKKRQIAAHGKLPDREY